MKKLLAILILLFSVNAYAYEFAEKWSVKDTAYQVSFLGLLGIDYLQTRTQAKNNWYIDGKQYRESCPFMSDHPDTKEVDMWFAGTAFLHTMISLALPPEGKIFGYKINPRRIWQGIWIGIESGYVINNYSVGVRIEF